MIPLTALIIGVILFIAYVVKNTTKIDKTDLKIGKSQSAQQSSIYGQKK